MKTIVIADDEPIVRMDVREMAEELGFKVVGEAADGFDAVELCRAYRPDVVFMDVKMPVFNGISASRSIMTKNLAGCVILLTSYSDQDIVASAAEAGVSGYLVKPIRKQNLLPAIEIASAQSRLVRENMERAAEAEKKLKDDRLIHRAQAALAEQYRCSSEEAYHRMRKLAMDKRLPLAKIASEFLSQNEEASHMAVVKKYLMTSKKMSEDRAYRYIVNFGKNHGISTEEAASRIYHFLSAEKPEAFS